MSSLAEVSLERARQDRKWGEQNHEPPMWMTILMEEVGECAQSILDQDYDNARVEAIQVAAVAVAFVEYLDRQGEP